MTELKVSKSITLKDFLTQNLHISATQAKKLLDSKKVFVNNQRVWIAGYKLKAGDVVEATVSQCFANAKHPTRLSLTRQSPSVASQWTPHDFARKELRARQPSLGDGSTSARVGYILAEDAEYLIINKPAGIIVNAHKNSLESRLQKDLKNPQLRAAHRLDKDTSGVIIFAKNQTALTEIIKVFKNLGVEKHYRGLAQGDLSKKFPQSFTLKQPVDGQSAETRFKIIKTNSVAGYFSAHLITGRKHQIRAHLAQAGFPLLGDNIYQTAKLNNAAYRRVPRQMLHAASVKFTNPISGKILQASAPEPQDFQDTLRLLNL